MVGQIWNQDEAKQSFFRAASARDFLLQSRGEKKSGRFHCVKYWEIIGDNLIEAGWSLGLCCSGGSQRAYAVD
jgi:hypothetical protein